MTTRASLCDYQLLGFTFGAKSDDITKTDPGGLGKRLSWAEMEPTRESKRTSYLFENSPVIR